MARKIGVSLEDYIWGMSVADLCSRMWIEWQMLEIPLTSITPKSYIPEPGWFGQ